MNRLNWPVVGVLVLTAAVWWAARAAVLTVGAR